MDCFAEPVIGGVFARPVGSQRRPVRLSRSLYCAIGRGGNLTMMKLYYAAHTCALASHIALEDAGAEYSTVRINFATEEQRKPEYLAINPKARVPSLVTERGILTETPAMLAFIAQSFPKARLAPLDDP